MKVARTLGWFNVDAMLATGEAWQLAEWIAFEQLEPAGDDWARSSMVATQVINELRELRQILQPLLLDKPQAIQLLDGDAFIPYRQPQRKKARRLSPVEGFAALRMGIGV